jgi:hypothetical protein
MWIDILKTGTWTANNGNAVTFTGEDLDNIQKGFNPKDRKAPLVFGHPKENGPAFGWTQELRRVGDKLQARFDQVSDTVKELVQKGHYKKVSISLFPDKKTLRHVGLLGAVQPAVAGLEDVAFDGGDNALEFEFTTQTGDDPQTQEAKNMEKIEELKKALQDEIARREAAETSLSEATKKADDAEKKAQDIETQLSAQQKAQKEKEIGDRIDKLIGKQILAADKPAIQAVAMSLSGVSDEIELSAGAGKKAVVDHLFDFLSALPDRGMMDEFKAPDGDNDKVEDIHGLAMHV